VVQVLGDARSDGVSVIEGHVDSYLGAAVFYRLGALRPGDSIDVTLANGITAVFRVTGVRQYAKSRYPAQIIYGTAYFPALRLITVRRHLRLRHQELPQLHRGVRIPDLNAAGGQRLRTGVTRAVRSDDRRHSPGHRSWGRYTRLGLPVPAPSADGSPGGADIRARSRAGPHASAPRRPIPGSGRRRTRSSAPAARPPRAQGSWRPTLPTGH
jgi:hypothetical protein